MSLHDLDAEFSVIGSCLIDASAVRESLTRLVADDFHGPEHSAIFAAIETLAASGSPVDEITVPAELERIGALEKAGGRAKIFSCLERVPTATNVAHYAAIVKEASGRRKTVAWMREQHQAITKGQSIADTKAAAEKFYSTLESSAGIRNFTVYDSCREAFKQLEAEALGEVEATRLRTGYAELDARCGGGVPKGWYIAVGGASGAGKSALALGLALGMCRNGARGQFFSMEMQHHRIARRVLMDLAEVASTDMAEARKITKEGWSYIVEAIEEARKLRLHICDESSLDVDDLCEVIKRRKEKYGLDFAVVDYLQLMKMEKSYSREREIGYTSQKLKALAQNEQITIIALVQINDELRKREDKTPQMSDIRESKAIGFDADAVWFIHRPFVFDQNTPSHEATFYARKMRDLATFELDMRFQPQYMRFVERGANG